MAGPVLSTVKVAPLVGAAVIGLPAASVPVLDATVLAPLTANWTTGESAIASLNVAVIVSVVPCLTGPVGEYAMDAVGFVLSTMNVDPLVGAAVSALPATSVPTLSATVSVKVPATT